MRGLGRWAGAIELGDSSFEREARDNFRKAVEYAPALEPVVEAVLSGEANTVLWVDYGKGPEKVRTGYAGALAEFRTGSSGTRSNGAGLSVRVDGSGVRTFEVAADFNDYATDHRWRSNSGLRQTKAAIGGALLYGGLFFASQADSWEEVVAGLVSAGLGALARESAAADVRHLEVLPQRSYFVALRVDEPDTAVALQVENRPGSRLVLPGLGPPAPGSPLTFRYVRLNRGSPPPAWATRGKVAWANDHTGSVDGGDLPFVLGGRCVRAPSAEVLAEYHAAGNLTELSLVDLENLYRAEGLTWVLSDQNGVSRTHVLEGGTSLIPPALGSTGFARLFCNTDHPSYVPRSDELRALRSRLGRSGSSWFGLGGD